MTETPWQYVEIKKAVEKMIRIIFSDDFVHECEVVYYNEGAPSCSLVPDLPEDRKIPDAVKIEILD
jgi:hypothetical protein